MSNPSKRIKTDFGSLACLDGESDKEQQNKRKLAQPTALDLLDLNVDCLFEIFERLDVMDLADVVQSCKYVKEIIFNLFQRKYKTLKLNFSDIVNVKTAVQARRLFKTFGSIIIELEIKFVPYKVVENPNSADILDAVIEHCTSLKTFKLDSFDIPDNAFWFERMGQLFMRLQKLRLRHVFIEDIQSSWNFDEIFVTPNENDISCFDNCSSLIELKLEESYFFYSKIFRTTFRSLKHFIIEDSVNCRSTSMDGFISRHPNLKTFSLDSEYSHIPVAAANLNLETLGFRFDIGTPFGSPSRTSVKSLPRFQKLKKLICFEVGSLDNMSNLIKVLPKLVNSLEVLNLSYGYANQHLIQVASSLKKLKVFRLYDIKVNSDITVNKMDLNPLAELIELTELILYIDTDNKNGFTFDLVKIVNRLANLTKLELFVNGYKLSNETYVQLLNCVESRPSGKQNLVIKCHTADDFKHLPHATVKIVQVTFNVRFFFYCLDFKYSI